MHTLTSIRPSKNALFLVCATLSSLLLAISFFPGLKASALSLQSMLFEQSSRSEMILGVKQENPLTLAWEDLLPIGDAERLEEAQSQFYAELAARYVPSSVPETEALLANIQEGSALDAMPQFGGFETVDALQNEYVRIPGYIVPLDLNSRFGQKEFLFVPHKGACIHTPPPPPNQIILIRSETRFRVQDIWRPYWVEGTLSAKPAENALASSAYMLEIASIGIYEGVNENL